MNRARARLENAQVPESQGNPMLRLILLARPWWKLLALSALCMLCITAANLVTPGIISSLVDQLSAGQVEMKQLIILAGVLTGVYILRAVFRGGQNYLSHKAAWTMVPELRVRMYDTLQNLSMRYFHDKQTGQLISRLINDSDKIELLIAHAVPELATNVVILVSVTLLLWMRNPTLTLFTFIPIPFMVIGSIVFSKRVMPLFTSAAESLGDLTATLQDNLSGIKEIQVFNQQHKERGRVEGKAKHYSGLIIRALRASAIFHPTVEFLTSMGTVIVVLFGGMLALQQRLSPGDIVAFVMYLNLFYQPISSMGRLLEDIQNAFVASKRVLAVMDAESEVKEAPDAQVLANPTGKVQFENVSFRYEQNKGVLDEVSFTAKPGEMIAIVGPTGVGKTTIISLLSRFYDPVAGRVLIDGQDISKVTLNSLHDAISIVLQDVFLFNGTVGENIAYGSKNATPEEIHRAAEIACADTFIQAMPQGYDTRIGERGTKLSGGQKQRLAIARAVLRNTPILVLDEATASVDVETEAQIQNAIQNLAGSRTIIVIAHRLSTVKRADQILVLSEGRVVEQGDHETLLQKGGMYSRLCRVQLNAAQLETDILVPICE